MAKRKTKTTETPAVGGQTTAPAGALPVISTETIGSFSKNLLAEVVGKNEDGKPVGLPYAEVLRRVKAKFPEGSTSLKSLAWYNSDMKRRDEAVPIRPRAVKAQAVAVAKEPAKAKEPEAATA